MSYSGLPGGHAAVVAVIGGGASGTLAASYLLRSAAAAQVPLRIALIDRHGRHGLGQAYSTQHPVHLLNSRADRMSVLAHDPGHLVRWAADRGIAHDGFLPRPAYGQYLRDVLAEAERAARPTATLTPVTSDVTGLTADRPGGRLRLHLRVGGMVDADLAILATGNQPPALPCPVPATPRLINDPWAPGALDRVADGCPVLIIGTGLTMLDVAVTVTRAHPAAVVHAVSRHALLPREHRCPPGGTAWRLALPAGRVGLRYLIRHVRVAAAQAGDEWPSVIDGLRPCIPALWQQLTPEDKRLFLRYLARYWEVHRHRVPPATARRIRQLREAGRLSVRPGRLLEVAGDQSGLSARIEHDGRLAEIRAGWVINATGPSADITSTTDPLLSGLLGRGLVRPDPLRLGIEADARGAVLDSSGQPSEVLFTLGPPLRGQLYETTAIPEIRDQAAALAARLVEAARARYTRGSAA
jgi:uncharacterized NAD(P)/FAD-binding protein YdhS